MYKVSGIIIAFCLSATAMAQNTTRLEIKSLPAYHSGISSIYIAGSFNGWNPQDDQYKFSKDEKGNYFLTLKLIPGKYEYKITRGGWDKVESRKGGAAIENRLLVIPTDKTVELIIDEWTDHFVKAIPKSTASKNVRIIDTSFIIPQLSRIRKVQIYLPENYSALKNKFPVLYIQDGQNVFDDSTSFAGEWSVDEFLDSSKAKQCIVVAIEWW